MTLRLWMAVLAVALANVVFGLWSFAPVAPPSATVGGAAESARPFVYPPRLSAPQEDVVHGLDVADSTPAPAPAPKKAAPAANCNVAACEAAYRSFRAEDCTYQPFDGGRRLCTKR